MRAIIPWGNCKAIMATACIVALVCGAPATALAADNTLPQDALTVLSQARDIELLSIEPAPESSSNGGFHGYRVLGKTLLKEVTVRKSLVESFTRAMEGTIVPTRCFIPRYGIRATHSGKTVEMLICFECSQFYVYDALGNSSKRFWVNQTPRSVFDKVLQDAGIPQSEE